MKKQLITTALMVLAFFGCVPTSQAQENFKVLFVLTSHDQLGNTGDKTGFWIEEFATPYYFLKDQGVEVVVATPKGGQAPIDPKSNSEAFQTPATKRYFKDAAAQQVVAATKKLSKVKAKDFDAVFYPGGHGPLWDLAEDRRSIALLEAFYATGKPMALVCHAPAALKYVKASNGQPLVAGRQVAGFTNSEEAAVQLTEVVPFLVEDMLKSKGATYKKGADWTAFAVEDNGLITGQNPQSSHLVAEKLLELLKKRTH